MTDTLRTESRGALLRGDRYIAFLGFVLLGYALIGKGFAYLGLPPLYVGEMAILGGIIVFLRTGASIGALATLPAVLLVALFLLSGGVSALAARRSCTGSHFPTTARSRAS
jgi:hypothetical protein